MKDRTMTYEEIFSHSMPFLNAMTKQVNRIRIIEAGGNPDKTDDENDVNDENKVFSTSKNKNYIEEESTLSDADFYGQLNSLLG